MIKSLPASDIFNIKQDLTAPCDTSVAVPVILFTRHLMAKFLSADRISDEQIQKKDIERQMNHYHNVASFTVMARPTNPVTGWVNFRTAPGSAAGRITTLRDGQFLTVIGETLDWYKAVDSVTGRTGYVSKAYVQKV